ncbi:hypothetical protein ACHQM5_015192 [Ranunculus cassubicifolius]
MMIIPPHVAPKQCPFPNVPTKMPCKIFIESEVVLSQIVVFRFAMNRQSIIWTK